MGISFVLFSVHSDMKTIQEQLDNLYDLESIDITFKETSVTLRPIPNIGTFITYKDVLYFVPQNVLDRGTWEQYLEVFLSSAIYRDTLRVNNTVMKEPGK